MGHLRRKKKKRERDVNNLLYASLKRHTLFCLGRQECRDIWSVVAAEEIV